MFGTLPVLLICLTISFYNLIFNDDCAQQAHETNEKVRTGLHGPVQARATSLLFNTHLVSESSTEVHWEFSAGGSFSNLFPLRIQEQEKSIDWRLEDWLALPLTVNCLGAPCRSWWDTIKIQRKWDDPIACMYVRVYICVYACIYICILFLKGMERKSWRSWIKITTISFFIP